MLTFSYLKVVELIRQRASAQGCPSLLLTADAVRTVVLSNGPSQLPAASITTPSQIAKNMITNASFRAKKIGDDIPKVESEAAAAAAAAGATNADIDRHLGSVQQSCLSSQFSFQCYYLPQLLNTQINVHS